MNTNNVTNFSDDFMYFQCICDMSVLWLVWTVTKIVSFTQQRALVVISSISTTALTWLRTSHCHTTLRTAHIDVNKEESKRKSCDQKGHCKWATERHKKAHFVFKYLRCLRVGSYCVVKKRIWFQWLACKQISLE